MPSRKTAKPGVAPDENQTEASTAEETAKQNAPKQRAISRRRKAPSKPRAKRVAPKTPSPECESAEQIVIKKERPIRPRTSAETRESLVDSLTPYYSPRGEKRTRMPTGTYAVLMGASDNILLDSSVEEPSSSASSSFGFRQRNLKAKTPKTPLSSQLKMPSSISVAQPQVRAKPYTVPASVQPKTAPVFTNNFVIPKISANTVQPRPPYYSQQAQSPNYAAQFTIRQPQQPSQDQRWNGQQIVNSMRQMHAGCSTTATATFSQSGRSMNLAAVRPAFPQQPPQLRQQQQVKTSVIKYERQAPQPISQTAGLPLHAAIRQASEVTWGSGQHGLNHQTYGQMAETAYDQSVSRVRQPELNPPYVSSLYSPEIPRNQFVSGQSSYYQTAPSVPGEHLQKSDNDFDRFLMEFSHQAANGEFADLAAEDYPVVTSPADVLDGLMRYQQDNLPWAYAVNHLEFTRWVMEEGMRRGYANGSAAGYSVQPYQQ